MDSPSVKLSSSNSTSISPPSVTSYKYQCDLCSQAFMLKFELTAHEKKDHPNPININNSIKSPQHIKNDEGAPNSDLNKGNLDLDVNSSSSSSQVTKKPDQELSSEFISEKEKVHKNEGQICEDGEAKTTDNDQNKKGRIVRSLRRTNERRSREAEENDTVRLKEMESHNNIMQIKMELLEDGLDPLANIKENIKDFDPDPNSSSPVKSEPGLESESEIQRQSQDLNQNSDDPSIRSLRRRPMSSEVNSSQPQPPPSSGVKKDFALRIKFSESHHHTKSKSKSSSMNKKMQGKRSKSSLSSTKKRIPCPLCPATFSFFFNMKRHCKSLHSHDVTSIPSAPVVTTTSIQKRSSTSAFRPTNNNNISNRSLRGNINSSGSKYKCAICTFLKREVSFSQPQPLIDHIKAKHRPGGQQVKKPTVTGQKTVQYKNKTKDQVSDDEELGERFPCIYPNCGVTFSRKAAVGQHVNAFHTQERRFLCPYRGCYFKFGRRDYLRRHMATHVTNQRGGGDCRCDKCGKHCKTMKLLQFHKKSQHPTTTASGVKKVTSGIKIRGSLALKTLPCPFPGCSNPPFQTRNGLKKHYKKVHKLSLNNVNQNLS